jgi:hypothetical protein
MLTAHYYHQCSTTAGMTSMYGSIDIVRADGTIVNAPRDVVPVWPPPHPANCGRIAGTDTVGCYWRSAPIFA